MVRSTALLHVSYWLPNGRDLVIARFKLLSLALSLSLSLIRKRGTYPPQKWQIPEGVGKRFLHMFDVFTRFCLVGSHTVPVFF